jgi:predicted phage terminase large subunit-like protein
MVIKQTAQTDALRSERFPVKTYVEREPGSGGKESAESTIMNLAGYPVYEDLPSGDKDTRLEPFAAQAEAGNVRLVRGPWNAAYIEELCSIPNGKYRDQADGTSGAFNKLVIKKPWGRSGVRANTELKRKK